MKSSSVTNKIFLLIFAIIAFILISRFLGEIDAGRFVHIDDIDVTNIPVVEDERSFVVRHDGY